MFFRERIVIMMHKIWRVCVRSMPQQLGTADPLRIFLVSRKKKVIPDVVKMRFHHKIIPLKIIK
jgi:hypothetical protein